MVSYDYYKFFDSFDLEFTKYPKKYTGMPSRLADAWCDLQSKSTRIIKFANTFGQRFPATSGVGQGDPLSLIPAIVLVSWQFYMVNHMYPKEKDGRPALVASVWGHASMTGSLEAT